MQLATARDDPGLIDGAYTSFSAWLQIVQGLGSPFIEQEASGWDLLAQALNTAVDRAYESCVQGRDPAQAGQMRRWAAWARTRPQLAGRVAASSYEDKANRCLFFTLDFASAITFTAGLEVMSFQVSATGVPVSLETNAVFPVSATLRLLNFRAGAPEGCSVTNDVHVVKPFVISSGKLVWGPPDNGKQDIVDVDLVIKPGEIAGSYTWTCPGPPGSPPLVQVFPIEAATGGVLEGGFAIGHLADADASGGGFHIRAWTMARSVFARKAYATGEPIAESTTFELKHAPR